MQASIIPFAIIGEFCEEPSGKLDRTSEFQ